jgi:putative glutamine amidotransferase
MSPPIIGITLSSSFHYPRLPREVLSQAAYFHAVRQAGGNPVKVEPLADPIDSLHLDGILFSGGGDINPRVYGEINDGSSLGIDDTRDSLELNLVQLAVQKDIPFLGICRGLQLINVAFGGSLYGDLNRQRPASLAHDWHPSRKYLAHSISIENESQLCDFGFESGFMVNSLHHQGIHVIGKGLSLIAYTSDGLIEAFELTGHHFGLAVQWHPEWLTSQQPTRTLFESFVSACEHTRH